MPIRKHRRAAAVGRQSAGAGQPGAELLKQRSLELIAGTPLPAVTLSSVRRHPHIFRKLVGDVEPGARAGDLVVVRTPQGELFGHALFNPRAEIALRMLNFDARRPGAEFWEDRLLRAVQLRRDMLHLDQSTDAYRVIHAEADGLSGLVADRYADVLSAEVYSLAMYQRSQALLDRLSALLGTSQTLIQVPAQTHGQEGFLAEPVRSAHLPDEVIVSEFGTRFRIRFDGRHKTGFFCDQRDNRRRLAEFCAGRSVLDLCCYTGGFSLQAARLGKAREVTAVDLDEKAIAIARDNARNNQQKIDFVHADAFGYMRDMIANGRTFDVVVLDPPKLIRNRREIEEGTRAHLDLNRLAVQLVADGGIFLSCSCSGLLSESEFLQLLRTAAHQAGKPATSAKNSVGKFNYALQILNRTGAAPDHPISADCPETEYLKGVWMRVSRSPSV